MAKFEGMTTYKVTVEIEFSAKNMEIALNHIEGIGFGDNDCDYKIVDVREAEIDDPFLPYDQGHDCAYKQWMDRQK